MLLEATDLQRKGPVVYVFEVPHTAKGDKLAAWKIFGRIGDPEDDLQWPSEWKTGVTRVPEVAGENKWDAMGFVQGLWVDVLHTIEQRRPWKRREGKMRAARK